MLALVGHPDVLELTMHATPDRDDVRSVTEEVARRFHSVPCRLERLRRQRVSHSFTHRHGEVSAVVVVDPPKAFEDGWCDRLREGALYVLSEDGLNG